MMLSVSCINTYTNNQILNHSGILFLSGNRIRALETRTWSRTTGYCTQSRPGELTFILDKQFYLHLPAEFFLDGIMYLSVCFLCAFQTRQPYSFVVEIILIYALTQILSERSANTVFPVRHLQSLCYTWVFDSVETDLGSCLATE